jgi:hypothetical protein
MTPYGVGALVAKLFEKLELKEPIEKIFPVVESRPNGMGIYAKVLMGPLNPSWGLCPGAFKN